MSILFASKIRSKNSAIENATSLGGQARISPRRVTKTKVSTISNFKCSVVVSQQGNTHGRNECGTREAKASRSKRGRNAGENPIVRIIFSFASISTIYFTGIRRDFSFVSVDRDGAHDLCMYRIS